MAYSLTYKNKTLNWSRAIIIVIITSYTLYYISTLSDWHFIDNVNLIFHEAGHIIFGFFGETIHMLGGTIMQILVPLIFCSYFYKKGDIFSYSLLLFWLGQNFLNISVYASDAIKMELPLLGGDNVNHDWNSLLSLFNILKYTDQVAATFYIIGIIILIFALIFAIKSSIKTNYTVTL